MMSAADVVELVRLLERSNCPVWIDGGWGVYPADGLAGSGVIQGQLVRCLSPQLQLRFHLGYAPDDDDRHDVALLCQHFGFDVPDGYRQPM